MLDNAVALCTSKFSSNSSSYYKIQKTEFVITLLHVIGFFQILHQWINLDFRPAYIIYEELHEPENVSVTIEFLKTHGYTYLTTLGWNHIFEYQDSKPP